MKAGSEFHVGTIGLGSMRIGAALSCVRAGLSAWDANLNSNTCVTLKEAGVCGAFDNAAAFAEKLDTLLVLVVSAAQVEQMLFGEKGVAQRLKPGTIVMVPSTIVSTDAREAATTLAGFGLEMLGTSVSGGTAKTTNDEMTVVASGSDIAFERLAPVLEAVAGRIYHIDVEPELGSTVKIIRQLLTGVHTAAGAETMALAARAGIPLDVMYDVVTNATRNSWMFENRIRHVVDGDYTPHLAVDVSVEDPGLIADIAKALHLPLSLASAALNMFTSASNAGYGKEDDSVTIKILSGIALPRARS